MGQELSSSPFADQWLSGHGGQLIIGPPPLELSRPRRTPSAVLTAGLRPATAIEIPFEAQRHLDGARMCGAAALAMVLKGLGVSCTQEELWDEIACPDGLGQLAARTFHLASAALRRGVPALVVQVKDLWRDLQQLVTKVPGLILNQRLEAGSTQGHFTVVLDVNEEAVLLHDPWLGPKRLVSRSTLEKLWRPGTTGGEEEVAGRVLVGIGPRTEHRRRCERCDLPFPADATCGACGQQFPLQPAEVLGCMRTSCGSCRWQVLFCPYCDAAFRPLR